MNCEAYIIKSETKETKFFPANLEWDKMWDLCRSAQEYEYLAIRRLGDTIYYIFLRQLVDKEGAYIGVGIALNGVVITDVKELYRFFNRELRTLVCNYNLAIYDKSSGTYRTTDKAPSHGAARNRLTHAFNTHFHNEADHPGPQDYTSRPTADTMRINEDGQVVRILTGESKLAERTIRQSIEDGNTVIVTSLMTDEQEIAHLNKLLIWYQAEHKRLTQALETTHFSSHNYYHPTEPQAATDNLPDDSHPGTISSFMDVLYMLLGLLIGAVFTLNPVTMILCGGVTWYNFFNKRTFAIAACSSTIITYIYILYIDQSRTFFIVDYPIVSIVCYMIGGLFGFMFGRLRRNNS